MLSRPGNQTQHTGPVHYPLGYRLTPAGENNRKLTLYPVLVSCSLEVLLTEMTSGRSVFSVITSKVIQGLVIGWSYAPFIPGNSYQIQSVKIKIAQWENECIALSAISVARVMIAQWENEYILLSVLSVAWAMIAQWENECISLSVLSVAQAMIAQWENECISLSAISVARGMIAQWENACISLSVLSAARAMIA